VETAFLAAIAAGDLRAHLDLGRLLLGIPGRLADACTALQRAAGVGIADAKTLFVGIADAKTLFEERCANANS
jgi:hypothetical protein